MLLSIIIPMFNSKNTIRRAIKSCLVGNLTDTEIILVDDGSTDSTVNVVNKSFKQEIDSNIIKIINSDHGGAGNARNIGIQNSKGIWIIFLDSDDEFINLENVKKDITSLDKSITILNYTPNFVRYGKSILYGKEYISDNLGLSNDNKKNWDSGPVYKCYKKSFLEKNNIKFPKNIKIGEDQVFNLQCLLKNSKVLTKRRYMYQIHEEKNSITHKIIPFSIVSDATTLVKRVLQFDITNDLKEKFIAKNFILVLVRFLKSNAENTTIIEALISYKKIFPIKKSFLIFCELHSVLNPFKIFIAWITWVNPKILKLIFHKVKK